MTIILLRLSRHLLHHPVEIVLGQTRLVFPEDILSGNVSTEVVRAAIVRISCAQSMPDSVTISFTVRDASHEASVLGEAVSIALHGRVVRDSDCLQLVVGIKLILVVWRGHGLVHHFGVVANIICVEALHAKVFGSVILC